ncbi:MULTISPECIES: FtsW/RodA/SpoVE family cell cycle protein [Helcococcus]|uniref:FtsW/RodA/SpoVE family cell cycle protein n=1 Tax=Helcococcus bovis TaxID=3153252 RepID=A0ABW9F6F8_9FIRM
MDINRSIAQYKSKKKTYNNFLIFGLFIFQFVGLFLSLLRNTDSKNITIILSIVFIVMTLLSNALIPKITKGDSTFILLVNLLFTISAIMMIRLDIPTANKHMMWYVLGLIIFLFVFFVMKYMDKFLKNKFILYFSLTFLTFLITFALGFRSGGAKNWIRIGNLFTIQLSEFAKIGYIFMLASYYYNIEEYQQKKLGKYYTAIATYIFSGMFFIQGELGTATLLFGLFLSTMFILERRYFFIILNIVIGLIGIYLASLVLSHIRVRIDIWLDPWKDYNNRGYQIIQGLFALANGSFFGAGIGLGRPDLVPVIETDYILAAIIEEMGIFMGFAILMIYIIIFYKTIKVALEFKSNYYSSLSMNIGLIFAFQTLIMFGGILKLIPLTGITTPFLSYGGSSTIVNFTLLGILQYLTTRTGGKYEKLEG